MSRSALAVIATAIAALALLSSLARPEPAAANPLDKVCGLIGTLGEGWMGKACHAVAHPKEVVGAAQALLSGKPGKAIKDLLGGVKDNIASPSGAVGIVAIVAWAVGGAKFVLSETAKLVGQTTSPELQAAWFSSVYWRVAGVAALLTLPFLVAAAIQAVLRSDGGLIARAVFGYLPLSFLATAVAAPTAMMLLAVTDWIGASVANAAGDQGGHFLALSGAAIGALGVAAGSPFVTFLVALLTAAGGLVLWLELLVREAAVYVVVLMLPLVFAAMVWPARRVWAVRSVEVLVALILAKFAIVSVLALAAAALGHGGGSLIVRSLAGLVLVMLGAFAPWVLLRLLPLAEVASAAAGHIREHAHARIASDTALGRHAVGTVSDGIASLLARVDGLAVDAQATATGPGSDRAQPAGRAVPNAGAPRADQPLDAEVRTAARGTASPSGASSSRSTDRPTSAAEPADRAQLASATSAPHAEQPGTAFQQPDDAVEPPLLGETDRPTLPSPGPAVDDADPEGEAP